MENDATERLERGLAGLAVQLTEPRYRECLHCYANRMLAEFGCDCTLRWARHWRERRAPQASGLEARLGARGACCDCEIFLNGWDLAVEPAVDDETGEPTWPDGSEPCFGVRAGSTQPCGRWVARRRGAPSAWG